MRDQDYLDDDEYVRRAFNKFCGTFLSGHIVGQENIRNFHAGFADALRDAYKKGWHKGWRGAPGDD